MLKREDDTTALLDELLVKSHFNLEEAISSLKFYWNLAQHKGLPIKMTLTGHAKVKGGNSEYQAKERIA